MKPAFRFVFPKTLPILAGFLFLGISFGIYAKSMGLPTYFPILMSAFIYAGSMEFVTVSLLTSAYNPIAALLLTLMVNGRHLFYGLAMLEPFKDLDFKRFFIIFGMCDESFSINSTLDIPENIDKGWSYFHVTWLNQFYWVLGSTLGATIGHQIPIPKEGIEFVLNALFIVLLIEIWLNRKQSKAIAIGMVSALISLFIFGQSRFMLPAMALILLAFSLRYHLHKGGSVQS
ncbi:TPA: AzlC family ABC transporter permease [Streptococcus suis]